MALSKKYKFTSDTIFRVDPKTNKRILPEDKQYLEQILDDIAECQGGYSACRGGIIMFDTDDNTKFLVTVTEGALVVTEITD